jgi:hypothetical protein
VEPGLPKRKNIFAAIVVTLGLALLAPSSAQATDVEARGLNADGQDYRITCPAGAYIVGFEAHTGDWVDRLQIVCAAWDPQTRTVGRPAIVDASAGASTGGADDKTLYCPGFQAVRSITFGLLRSDNHYLDNLASDCASMDPPYAPGASSSFSTNDDTETPSIGNAPDPALAAGVECPAGELATGIHGRASEFIYALGLVCAPGPAPAHVSDVNKAHLQPKYRKPFRPSSRAHTVP